ncbi:hypothetical protein PN302_02245 [Pediococcus acidilactici]|nr:hypothetical protein [Pediococcus acidilactici]
MKDSRFNWQVPSLPDVDIAELAKATQLDPIIVRILVARGFRTADEMTNFLAMDQVWYTTRFYCTTCKKLSNGSCPQLKPTKRFWSMETTMLTG